MNARTGVAKAPKVRLDAETADMLVALSEERNESQAETIRRLIRSEYRGVYRGEPAAAVPGLKGDEELAGVGGEAAGNYATSH